MEPTETQVSYDVVNLYASVPLDRSIQVIVEFLEDDDAELKKRTKLYLTDIQNLSKDLLMIAMQDLTTESNQFLDILNSQDPSI